MGPGIAAGSTITQLSANYDLAMTWSELAAAPPNAAAAAPDGKSLVSLLHPAASTAAAAIRTFTLQEGYQSCEAGHGEGKACSKKSSRLLLDPTALALSGRSVYDDCWFGSAENEAAAKGRDYSGLRLLDPSLPAGSILRDALYVEYTDGGKMYFDVESDPWQTRNIFTNLTAADAATLTKMLAKVRDCTGKECP
jgi:hypothetical protein